MLFNNSSPDLREPQARRGDVVVQRRRRWRLGHDHRDRDRGRRGARRPRPRAARAGGAPTNENDAGVSARFVTGKVLGSLVTLFFVICFNFFLFRVVEGDPVASLFRGRNLTASPAGGADEAVRPGRVDRRAVRALPGADGARSTSAARTRRTSRCRRRSRSKAWADDRARRDLDAALDGVRRADRHRRGVATKNEGGLHRHHVHDGDVLDARLLARDAAAVVLRRDARLVPGGRHRGRVARTRPASPTSPIRPSTCSCRASR